MEAFNLDLDFGVGRGVRKVDFGRRDTLDLEAGVCINGGGMSFFDGEDKVAVGLEAEAAVGCDTEESWTTDGFLIGVSCSSSSPLTTPSGSADEPTVGCFMADSIRGVSVALASTGGAEVGSTSEEESATGILELEASAGRSAGDE